MENFINDDLDVRSSHYDTGNESDNETKSDNGE